ncbi:hypothetical protein C1645_786448, partial [Glomus cerebriforme]
MYQLIKFRNKKFYNTDEKLLKKGIIKNVMHVKSGSSESRLLKYFYYPFISKYFLIFV